MLRGGDDFRARLYERYVSTLKGRYRSPQRPEAQYSWWDAKLLPLLRTVNRRGRVLELGCGAGTFLKYLQARGFTEVEGIDISPEQVALGRQAGLPVQQGDVRQALGRVIDRWDLIVAMDFLEHHTRDELVELVPLIREALCEGGTLLIQVPNGMGLHSGQVVYGDLTHMTVFTPDSLRQLLACFGLVDVEVREAGPAATGITGRLRCVLWFLVKLPAAVARLVEAGKRQTIWTETMLATCRRTVEALPGSSPSCAASTEE